MNGRVTVTSLCGYSTDLTSLFRSESVWLCRAVSLQEMCMPGGFIPAFLSWLVLLSDRVLFQSNAYM